jgi:hypothetical protein
MEFPRDERGGDQFQIQFKKFQNPKVVQIFFSKNLNL